MLKIKRYWVLNFKNKVFEKELFAYFDGTQYMVNFSDYVKAYIAYCFNNDTISALRK